jgi:myo-inositol-1(or 4)-monophosphatase
VSPDPNPAPADLERVAVRLCEGAADLLRSRAGGTGAIGAKSTQTDLVTEADREVERWLTARLAELRPEDAVLGEEAGRTPGRSGVRWLVDPIDGTVNFVLGLPQFAVSVAAECDGEVLAGAVCNPATGETYRASRGAGAWLRRRPSGEVRLGARRGVPVHRAVVGTGFGYDAAVRARQSAVLATLLPQVADIRRMGSASLDLCAVAAGRLDAHFEAGLNPWDFAAGLLIAAEAGCVASGLRGRQPSGRFLAVADPSCADELFALLEAAGADQVLAD